jgi:hypothetical protein
MVLSLSARGLTHGDISAHLAEVYGASVSKSTISTITDKVMDGMAEWQNRPLDAIYPVIFIDCIHVKVRDGQVANRPIYVALAVTVDGTRDILGLWAGDGGEGCQAVAPGPDRDQEPRRRGRVHGRLRRLEGPARLHCRGLAAGDHADLPCDGSPHSRPSTSPSTADSPSAAVNTPHELHRWLGSGP